MRSLMQRILASGSSRLAAAAIVGQLLGFAFLPVLARLYTPGELGALALFLTTGSAIGGLAALRLELAIVVIEDHADAVVMRALCYRVVLAFAAVVAVVVVALFVLGGTTDIFPFQVDGYWALLPLLVFGIGATAIETNWALRLTELTSLSLNRIERPFYTNASQAISPLLGIASTLWLALSTAVSYTGTAWWLRRRIDKSAAGVFDVDAAQGASMRSLFARYRSFTFLNGPNVVVDAVRSAGLLMMIGGFYGAFDLGQFSQAWRLMWIPVSLISGVVSQVAFARLARLDAPGRYAYFTRIVLLLSACAVMGGLILVPTAPHAFSLLLGDQWDISGQIARALIPWLILNIAASPASNALIVLKRPGLLLALSCLYGVSVLGACITGASLGWDIVTTSWLISACAAATLGVLAVVSIAAFRREAFPGPAAEDIEG